MNDQTYEKLLDLIDAMKKGNARLTPGQEQEAAHVMKGLLQNGTQGVASVLEAMIQLPWMVGVTAIVECWPQLNDSVRKQLFVGLGTEAYKTDNGVRVRLSLARALTRVDLILGLKMLVSICSEICSTEDRIPTPRHRHILLGVFIGKGKPWIQQIPLTDLKEVEIDQLVHCAAVAAFLREMPSPFLPPFVQLSLLQWIDSLGRLAALSPKVLASAAESISRWNGRWMSQLATSIPSLPSPLSEVIASRAALTPREPREDSGIHEGMESRDMMLNRGRMPRRPLRGRPMAENGHASSELTASGFDFATTIRQIENHVNHLEAQLSSARIALRDREEELQKLQSASAPAAALPEKTVAVEEEAPKTRGRKKKVSAVADSGDIEELRKHNAQLEATLAEMRERLEELSSDHEDIADSRQHDEAVDQFKALLSTKLGEVYSEFVALKNEPVTDALGEHYRKRMEEVFALLQKQGVPLKASKSVAAAS